LHEETYRVALSAAIARHVGAVASLHAQELTGDLRGDQVTAARIDVIRTFQTELAAAWSAYLDARNVAR
jgi:hypothetical protein